ncbi:D-alanyl-D-alanine carboxypeptidase/D-alanyl-D-alanine-endopeptidase [Pedobacter sp. SAFR-022]|uniref:D-alanyl-D-alanine carboxypeptidase/D-alanyl-D-alanine-endopeptidase n=1 Tax=Pedobacter sp. SAFR-022 TaxID=3436861 RepID=UPI003F7EEDD3
MKKIILGLLASIVCSACSMNQKMAKQVARQFDKPAITNQYHTGFALYDLQSKRMIYEKDADRYFVPASNTKLYTFYAGLKMLGDSIPALRYVERGDSLIFWGTGDPSFLENQLKSDRVLRFLKHSPKKLFFAAGRYTGNFYGNGWSWDDFNDYYQPEINEFPIKDNMLALSGSNGKLQVLPASLNNCVVKDTSADRKAFRVVRAYDQNLFRYPDLPVPADFTQYVPYKTSTVLTVNLLTDTVKRSIGVVNMKMPGDAKTLYSVKTDSVLKAMMLPSDNFIAEQLLLVYSNSLGAELNGSKAIAHVRKQYLSNLPGNPSWVDGSGLSKGNLFSPRDMVSVLDSIYHTVKDQKRLFDMLPAGGKSGTLKNAYPKTDDPFVYGKTGTLSGVHNQSGYVLTKKGKVLIYSFMNNNYVLPTAEVRKEMARVVSYIHEHF